MKKRSAYCIKCGKLKLCQGAIIFKWKLCAACRAPLLEKAQMKAYGHVLDAPVASRTGKEKPQ